MNDAENPTPISAPPVLSGPPVNPPARPSSWRKLLGVVLSLFLGLFLANGVTSLLDDSFVLLWGNHCFTLFSGIVFCVTCLAAIFVYALMGLSPVVPKRIVLPAVIFLVIASLLVLPATIYFFGRLYQIDWVVSCAEVMLAWGLIRRLQGGRQFRWLPVRDEHLGTRAFSWLNLSVFLAVNILVLLPGVVAYVGGCANLAVRHFTDGFVSLRPSGIMLQARKYVRDDGKTILLFPMSHIAESDFYRSVTRTVSSNSVVLLEGVTDNQNRLTNRITYQRAAKALHLSEQHEDFQLNQGELVRADVDVSEFSSNTIAVLNLVTLIHSQGVNLHTISMLLQFNPPPEIQWELLDDLLHKRNQHVLGVLRARLPGANDFIIPWGAAHMAGLSQEIQKSGFRLAETHDYVSIRFYGKPKD